ncbi:MAG: (d)CMP kinase [Clostridia bacterium]|nr:(d)CMP kinase [Clostridia bacterium]
MNGKRLNIAMDGPVGAGKSSIADAVAGRLGILHLDTGAMYRAIGLCAIRTGTDLADEQAVTAMAADAEITVAHGQGGQHTYLNGEDVTGLIRTEQVSMAASAVAKYGDVRKLMVRLQQQLAAEQDMLVDGRDICLRVLPDANVKLFLTASAEERARRRYLELQKKGSTESYETVLEDLKQRDAQDMNRAVDPLRPTEDAIIVDSTDLTFEQVVDKIIAIAEEKMHE